MSINEQLPHSEGVAKLPAPLPDIFDNLEAVRRHSPDFGRHSGAQDDLITRIGDHTMRLADLYGQLATRTDAEAEDSHRITPDILEASLLAHRHAKKLDDPEKSEDALAARTAAADIRQSLLRGDKAVADIHEHALIAVALINGALQDAFDTITGQHRKAAENTQNARAKTRTAWDAVFRYHYGDPDADKK